MVPVPGSTIGSMVPVLGTYYIQQPPPEPEGTIHSRMQVLVKCTETIRYWSHSKHCCIFGHM